MVYTDTYVLNSHVRVTKLRHAACSLSRCLTLWYVLAVKNISRRRVSILYYNSAKGCDNLLTFLVKHTCIGGLAILRDFRPVIAYVIP